MSSHGLEWGRFLWVIPAELQELQLCLLFHVGFACWKQGGQGCWRRGVTRVCQLAQGGCLLCSVSQLWGEAAGWAGSQGVRGVPLLGMLEEANARGPLCLLLFVVCVMCRAMEADNPGDPTADLQALGSEHSTCPRRHKGQPRSDSAGILQFPFHRHSTNGLIFKWLPVYDCPIIHCILSLIAQMFSISWSRGGFFHLKSHSAWEMQNSPQFTRFSDGFA